MEELTFLAAILVTLFIAIGCYVLGLFWNALQGGAAGGQTGVAGPKLAEA